MTEEFAFDEARRDGAAVHLHQRTILTGAAVMNRSRDEFLPRSRLSVDEHGRVRWCNLFDFTQCHQKSGAVPDNLFEVMLCADLLLEVNVLLLQSGL